MIYRVFCNGVDFGTDYSRDLALAVAAHWREQVAPYFPHRRLRYYARRVA